MLDLCELGLEKGLCNHNMVVFDTTLMARGTTIMVRMPVLFLSHCVRLWLGLG